MAMRQAGNEEGKGEGSKGNVNNNEAGWWVIQRARAARQWQWQQGLQASGLGQQQRGQ